MKTIHSKAIFKNESDVGSNKRSNRNQLKRRFDSGVKFKVVWCLALSSSRLGNSWINMASSLFIGRHQPFLNSRRWAARRMDGCSPLYPSPSPSASPLPSAEHLFFFYIYFGFPSPSFLFLPLHNGVCGNEAKHFSEQTRLLKCKVENNKVTSSTCGVHSHRAVPFAISSISLFPR